MRRRRRKWQSSSLEAVPIRDFVDACAEAFALKARFDRGAAAFELDARGRIVQAWALAADHHTIHDAVAVLVANGIPVRGGGVLLFTVTTDSHVAEVRPPDDVTWAHLRSRLRGGGRRAIDWLLVGETTVRSMHFTCGGQDAPPWPWRVE